MGIHWDIISFQLFFRKNSYFRNGDTLEHHKITVFSKKQLRMGIHWNIISFQLFFRKNSYFRNGDTLGHHGDMSNIKSLVIEQFAMGKHHF